MTVSIAVTNYPVGNLASITATIDNAEAVVGSDIKWTSTVTDVINIDGEITKIEQDNNGDLISKIEFTPTKAGTSVITAAFDTDISAPVTTTVIDSTAFDYIINSSSSEWCLDWQGISKEIYVQLADFDPASEAHQKLLEDAFVIVKKDERRGSEPEEIGLVKVDTAIPAQFNEYGVAIVQVSLTGATVEEDFTFLTAEIVDGDLVLGKQEDEFRVEFEETSLQAPNIPAANTGAITDEDIAKGVWVTLHSPAALVPGDLIEVYFGTYHFATEVETPAASYRFKMPEIFMDNGVHDCFYSIVDDSGNMSFSRFKKVRVDRKDISEEGFNDLSPAIILEGENHGVINKADAVSGVRLVIPADVIKQLADGNVSEGSLVYKGYLNNNTPIQGAIGAIDLKATYDGAMEAGQLPNPWIIYRTPGYDFFKKIGEGIVGIKYSVKYISDNHYHSSNIEKKYRVDVIPPRR